MRFLLVVWVCVSLSQEARGAEQEAVDPPAKPARPVDGIRDNSFLVEEAYNQESGVVQHIFTLLWTADDRGSPHIRAWDLGFTQEWPLGSQKHQLSYTIPYAFLDDDGAHDSALGDVSLNYRYQLLDDDGTWPAFAPRVSVIAPTGDDDRGFGDGVWGAQFNLPFSKTLSDRVYVNLNLGLTYLPNVDARLSNGRTAGEYDLLSYHLSGSVIYAVSDTFHLLLEAIWNANEELAERDSVGGRRLLPERGHSDEVILSPGFRWAWNHPSGLQVVPGLAFPIGLSDDAADYGVFFYVSLEHSFMRTNQ